MFAESIKPAIVVVGYNRPNSLKRILQSLSDATYPYSDIPLIISLDKSDNILVRQIAEEYDWKHGDKTVLSRPEKLGLRKHILKCGDLVNTYSSIILLEDDLYAGPHFYSYTVKMLEEYGDIENIAGISLYNHNWNVNVNLGFHPLNNGYDVYLLQFAQSWGQCWNRRMWNEFYEWYKENESAAFNDADVPAFVCGWPQTSWLKYFVKFVVKKDKFFVYPYLSQTTNFGDSGTHHKLANSTFQVPVATAPSNFRCPGMQEILKYDVFFENTSLDKYLGIDAAELTIDLYGSKPASIKRYWLTPRLENYSVVKSFALKMRPHELNVIMGTEGTDLFLYDISEPLQNAARKNPDIIRLNFELRGFSIGQLYKLLVFKLVLKTKKFLPL